MVKCSASRSDGQMQRLFNSRQAQDQDARLQIVMANSGSQMVPSSDVSILVSSDGRLYSIHMRLSPANSSSLVGVTLVAVLALASRCLVLMFKVAICHPST
jgi:hypothetical protein